MPDTDIRKALELLNEAKTLLKASECENLKKSANYLVESIELLKKHKSGSGRNIR